MTSILLIRHGQAAFGANNYDQLCERGIKQAKILGAHFVRERRAIVAAVSGTLRRQRETAVHTLAAMELEIPLATDPRFDEYSIDGLFSAYLPLAASRVPELAKADATLRHDRKLFQLALSTVMDLWLSGATGLSGESWRDFQDRVRCGLETVISNSGRTDLVAIFTSGGVIAAAICQVLALSPRATLNLQWRIPNSAVTELRFGRSGLSLVGFNMIAHLRLAGDEALLTYR
jgi:broad specificity phosphatase PhoE